MKSVVEQIFNISEYYPDKIALIEGKRQITYAGLKSKILSINRLLCTLYKLRSGDRIIIAANKQLEFVYLYFASHLSGIIVVPIDSETNSDRFNYIVNKTLPKLIVGFHCRQENCPTVPISAFEEVICDINIPFAFPDLESASDIIFTTGTTGLPKGVILTHRNIAASVNNINAFIRNSKSDIELLVLPISHSFGLGRLRCVLAIGATLILLGSLVNMKRFYHLIEEFRVSGIAMVPSSWAFLRKMSGLKLGNYANCLNYIEIGSAPMPLEDKQLLITLFPKTRICMHYGLTEASRSAFMEFHEDSNHLLTVGKPTPNVDIAIMDENGNKLPINCSGEICIQGDSVMKYYWDEQESTSSFFGNYFRTGDWGLLDFSGYLILQSRKKELINVGGKKVSPIEVETVLLTIPDLQDCACIGIIDPNGVLGEVVKAFLVKQQGSHLEIDDIKKYMSGKLEGYKLPIEYEWISMIPQTISGKKQRLALKNDIYNKNSDN
ncbi:class I adenylate-forming enzyme family protein [Bacteroides nordii]|jgi:long-chain acyl-CoA synthetase|uniref:class I adenylate-forming enzyme family protein n=1 Tax=Bacteroides nordii TaxID=291645 RepID=UPI00189FA419|nr:class I adenylate-forming enzyme family protein [Bacteroides nordii]